MDADRVNKWLTLGANLGVFAGLLLLAFEIRQTNYALDRDYDVFVTDVQGRAREGWREFNSRIIESAEVADIWIRGNAGAPLTTIEAERYRYLTNDVILLYQLQFEQYRIAGRDTEALMPWLERLLRNRPGLEQALARIVSMNPESEFSQIILEVFPQLPMDQ